MTDDNLPLSRRERRTLAAREAARAMEDTDALGGMPISESIPTHSAEGRALTRRERRRLERARMPMETWTAEEEMIATGQIPAMTPERIAEQERIAHEKAEAAQREARAASSRFPLPQPSQNEADARVGRADKVASAASPFAPSAPEDSATADSAPDDSAPDDAAPAPRGDDAAVPRASVFQPPAPQPSTPWLRGGERPDVDDAWRDSDESVDDQPLVPQRTSLIPAPPEPAQAFEPEEATPEPDEALAEASGDAEAPPAEVAPSARSAAPVDEDEPGNEPVLEDPQPSPVPLGMPPGMSPDMFATLFPPGSLQRRLMEQQAEQQAELEQETQPEAPEEPVPDPADELRHLSQQAAADSDAASHHQFSALPEHDDPAAEAAAKAVLPQAWGPALGNDDPPASGGGAGSVPTTPVGYTPATDQTSGPEGSAASAPSASSGPSEEAAVSLDQAPFAAILGDHPATAALDQASGTSVDAHRPAFHTVSTPQGSDGLRIADVSEQLTPHYVAFDVPQSDAAVEEDTTSLWATHPLMQVDRAAPELPEVEAAQDIPQPDLSSVRRPAFAPLSGDMSSIEPVPTGQIEVPPRERPGLEGADGPRHFRWAHLAVFGAVAFLLGVVVWNVAMRP